MGLELFRYKSDPRSIPVLGDTDGVVRIGSGSRFSVVKGNLIVCDPVGGGADIGTHMQYKVNIAK